MLKSEEQSNPKSCLSKAADAEPVFVLRAQDVFAPSIVRRWAYAVMQATGSNEKTAEALALADAMEAWPTRKVPD